MSRRLAKSSRSCGRLPAVAVIALWAGACLLAAFFNHLGTLSEWTKPKPLFVEVGIRFDAANDMVPLLNNELSLTYPVLGHWYVVFSFPNLRVSEWAARLPAGPWLQVLFVLAGFVCS